MNSKTLYLAFSGVDEALLERSEAAPVTRHAPMRWMTLAACLCLVATLLFPTVRGLLKGHGGDHKRPLATLEYGGKFYEAVDDPAILEKYGLPRQITAEMAGEQLIYLTGDKERGYDCTAKQTDKVLCHYAPAPGDAVYIVQDGSAYLAAIFCNFYQFDSNTSCELTELYRVYRISSAEDIASITEVDRHREKTIGTPLTDRQEIGEFYDRTIALWSYGNDDFQKAMFGGCTSEEEQLALHTAFAEDSRVLRLETAEGLRFYLNFYPTYRWIYGGGTMSYFQIDEPLLQWFDRNFSR